MLRPVLDTETQLAVDAFGDHLSTSFVGTIEYVAPEVIMQEGYSGSVDWWTFGVLLYEMVFGKTPFKGKDMNGTLAHVLNADIDFDMPDDDEIRAIDVADAAAAAAASEEVLANATKGDSAQARARAKEELEKTTMMRVAQRRSLEAQAEEETRLGRLCACCPALTYKQRLIGVAK